MSNGSKQMMNFTKLTYKSWLYMLCPLITLIPVLTFLWSTPAEALITLVAWSVSNGMVMALVWLLGRMERATLHRVTA